MYVEMPNVQQECMFSVIKYLELNMKTPYIVTPTEKHPHSVFFAYQDQATFLE